VLEKQHTLSRRERQIMDVLYRSEKLTAAGIQQAMPDAPGYSAVRAMLRTLEQKGHVRHEVQGLRYVYRPVVSRHKAMRTAVRHLVDTFFRGSVENAVAALLAHSDGTLTPDRLSKIEEMIARARKEGR
jgi:predicted transcriptional regulator